MRDRSRRGKKGKRLFMFGGILVLMVILLGVGLVLLWNWLMPTIFGFGEINFIQGIGLLVLSKILFGGIKMKSGGNQKIRQTQIKNALKEVLAESKPEQAPYDSNEEVDELYETWWTEEGEAYFDDFIKDKLSEKE